MSYEERLDFEYWIETSQEQVKQLNSMRKLQTCKFALFSVLVLFILIAYTFVLVYVYSHHNIPEIISAALNTSGVFVMGVVFEIWGSISSSFDLVSRLSALIARQREAIIAAKFELERYA